MTHYYKPGPPGEKRLIPLTIHGQSFEFLSYTSLFSGSSIDEGTRLLLENIVIPEEGVVLDIGCGYGVIGIVVARLNPRLKVYMFSETLGDGSPYGVSIRYVTQERRLGIAHAIYRAVENGVDNPFVVHLGDNIFEEGVSRFIREFAEGDYEVFIVLTRARDPTRFGCALIRDGRVVRLVEKPKEPPPGSYVVTGFYAFRDPDMPRARGGLADPGVSWIGC